MKGKWLPEEVTVRKANLKRNAKAKHRGFCVQEGPKALNMRQACVVQHLQVCQKTCTKEFWVEANIFFLCNESEYSLVSGRFFF